MIDLYNSGDSLKSWLRSLVIGGFFQSCSGSLMIVPFNNGDSPKTVVDKYIYSKTCVKPPLSKRQKIGFQD